MQFVLDNEVDWAQRAGQPLSTGWLGSPIEPDGIVALDMAEEGACASFPRHIGEFVNRRDHKGRQPAIDLLVDDNDRQPVRPREIAVHIVAANVQALRRRRRWMQTEAVRIEFRAAPRAGFERRRGRAAPLRCCSSQ